MICEEISWLGSVRVLLRVEEVLASENGGQAVTRF